MRYRCRLNYMLIIALLFVVAVTHGQESAAAPESDTVVNAILKESYFGNLSKLDHAFHLIPDYPIILDRIKPASNELQNAICGVVYCGLSRDQMLLPDLNNVREMIRDNAEVVKWSEGRTKFEFSELACTVFGKLVRLYSEGENGDSKYIF